MRRVIPGILLATLVLLAWTVHPSTGSGRTGDATRPRQIGVRVERSDSPFVLSLSKDERFGQDRPVEARTPAAQSPRNANYRIAVSLNPARHGISGHETIVWRNISRIPTSELRFHLYYNAWRNTRSTFFREAALAGEWFGQANETDLGWTEVTAIRLIDAEPTGGTDEGGTHGGSPTLKGGTYKGGTYDSGERARRTAAVTPRTTHGLDLMPARHFVAPDDGNEDDRTVMSVALPREVKPGETVTVELEWTAHVPRTFARTGVVGNFYFFGQWFPKIGVLEDDGWNCHQFHASTEFFADYGVYDVSMTIPAGWTVGATGRETGHRDEANGTTTMRYLAEDVHDFAWTTSPDYLERSERFEAPGLPPVEMRLLLQPEHVAQAERHFRATAAALRYYGEWFGPYPYPSITIVDPAWQSDAGGMEYPTLFTAGTHWLAPEGATSPEHVTVHECGHQFWYALVGNNEFEDAWLDEGLNTYSTSRVIDQVYRDANQVTAREFGGFVPLLIRGLSLGRVDGDGIAGYRQVPRVDLPSKPSWRYWPTAAGTLSYSKTALWLHTLENHLGWPAFRKCLATYFERWRFRHPRPADFFGTVNEVSGQDLTWFFDQVYRDTRVFDYGIDTLGSAPEPRGERASGLPRPIRTTVVARRFGDGVFPVDVVVRFADGTGAREHWDGRDVWKAFTFDRDVAAVSAEIDPERVLALDVNRTNNSRLAQPAASPAATRWMAAWMVWLEDWMMTCANFV